MNRLTMDNLDQMGMYDLAHNCCYAYKGKARYRDFDTDIDAREFARNLMVAYGKWKSCEEHGLDADNEMVDDEIFDGTMLDNLMYEPMEIEGLIALFYRNLWGMADLREVLKYYEDADEQGRLLRLACNVGDTVYIKGIALDVSFIHIDSEITYVVEFACDDCGDCPFYEDEVSWEGEHSCRTNGYIEFKETDIGKTVFLTFEEMKAALKQA